MIGADAFEIGRGLRKAIIRPKNFIPIFPQNFVPIQRLDGRINFISSDKKGNFSFGEDCKPEVIMIEGSPALTCSSGKQISNKV